MSYNLYLFHADESATILYDPMVLDVPLDIDEFSKDQLIQIFQATAVGDDLAMAGEMNGWSERKIIQAIFDINGIAMDSYAVIDARFEHDIRFKGKELLETMEDDSSCYAAAEEFADMLIHLAERTAVGSFPYPDFNIEHYSDIT